MCIRDSDEGRHDALAQASQDAFEAALVTWRFGIQKTPHQFAIQRVVCEIVQPDNDVRPGVEKLA